MDFNGQVSVTAIVFDKDQRVLLTRRHKDKKKWPGFWTVPGGKVSTSDFLGTPTEINNQWYSVLETAVKREVKEETGFYVKQPIYLCSITIPDTIIVSFTAEFEGGREQLQEDEVDAIAWINEGQINDYELIDGIAEEIREFYKRGF